MSVLHIYYLFVTLQTHLFLFYTLAYSPIQLYFFVVAQNCSALGTLSDGFWNTLINPHCCRYVFVKCFLTSWHYKMLQTPSVYFLSQSWNKPFLQNSPVWGVGLCYGELSGCKSTRITLLLLLMDPQQNLLPFMLLPTQPLVIGQHYHLMFPPSVWL